MGVESWGLRQLSVPIECAFLCMAINISGQVFAQPSVGVNTVAFEGKIPADQLSFVRQFGGAPAKDLFRDKQFRKPLKSFVPDCELHYGRDMSPRDALE